MELLSDFDFEIIYVPRTDNVLTNSLSCLYSNKSPGVVCAPSEYPQHDEDHPADDPDNTEVTRPILTGLEANAIMLTRMGSGTKPKWTLKPKIGANESSAVFAKQIANKKFVLHGPKASSEAGIVEGLPLWNDGPDLGRGVVPSWNKGDELHTEGESVPSSSMLNIKEDRDGVLPRSQHVLVVDSGMPEEQ